MGATTVLAAAGVCPPGSPHEGWIAVADGHIIEIGSGRAPHGATSLDDALLVPGFVDLQVNGVADIDFATADPDAWRRARLELARHGVTAACPTFVSAPLDSYPEMLTRVLKSRAVDEGTVILGVHLEGPFLGDAPGAHPPELLCEVDVEWLDTTLAAFPDLVRVVTLAPEADTGLKATRLLAAAGVVVALGHSRASYDETRAAADAGARVVTHIFNGMGPLHHREPGLVGAALDDDRLVPTLIADLVHVHPATIRLVLARKEKVALVSDVVAVTADLDTDSGAATLPDGTLCGATAHLDRAVANVAGLGVPIERAVAMAATVPAEVVGASQHGRLVAGARADIVALDPTTFAVRQTWIAGNAMIPN